MHKLYALRNLFLGLGSIALVLVVILYMQHAMSTFIISTDSNQYESDLKTFKRDEIKYDGTKYLDCFNITLTSWHDCYPSSNGFFLKNLDLNQYKYKERKFLESHLPEMIERIERMNLVCSVVKKEKRLDRLFLLWDQDHSPNVIYCNNYKAASGHWTTGYILMKVSKEFGIHNMTRKGFPLDDKAITDRSNNIINLDWTHQTAYKLYPAPEDNEEAIKVFKNSLKFLVVRHPFTRIVSAYRDQLQRTEYSNVDMKNRVLSYHKGKKKHLPVRASEAFSMKNFPDFIEYLLSRATNPHINWLDENLFVFSPSYVQCSVCESDFGLVMKTETLQKDEKFLSILADYEAIKEELKIVQQNPKRERIDQIGAVTSDSTVKGYFKLLSRSQILKLFELYKIDFDMFSYDVNEYIN